jgi:hypothetical protein
MSSLANFALNFLNQAGILFLSSEIYPVTYPRGSQ